jgi:branched-chain amino acid transport system permease protein
LCLPQAEESSCISGTLGGRGTPIGGADVILTKPDGETETVTTEDDGRFSFQVTEEGEYFISVDEESLPEGMVIVPPSGNAAGPDGSLKVTINRLGTTVAGTPVVRSEDYSADATGKVDQIVKQTFSGIRLGLLLAMASVGLSLIYGTTGLSNFAHAEQVTLGGMLAYWLVSGIGLPLLVGCALAVVICGATGFFQDLGMWQPLRRRGLGLTQMMIVTIGMSLALQYVFQYAVGASQRKITTDIPETHTLGPIVYSNLDLLAMAISAAVLGAVGYVLLRTRIGRATRAVSDNPALAAASGIDVDKVIRLVWTVSMALAGLSGILYALVIQRGVKWDTGLQILLLLFAAVTLGGLGTAFGALIGSLIIGLIVELAPVLGAPGDLKFASALLILILLLLVRPQGLLGRAERVG